VAADLVDWWPLAADAAAFAVAASGADVVAA